MECNMEVEHPFPPTKLMWMPDDGSGHTSGKPDLLATTGTSLRLWRVEDGQVKAHATLSNTKGHVQDSGQAPPLTSFDWSTTNHHKVGSSSIDTTCTIWNIEKERIETQLIAHDKAVYDIAFSSFDQLFASVGADGSLRLFDQRNLEQSMIIYEAQPVSPLVRLSWNKLNTNYIACVAMDQTGVIVLDVRKPSIALNALAHHEACVNSMTWSPHSRNHLLCGTDDGFGLIWDVKEAPARQEGASPDPGAKRPTPLLSYDCDAEVHQVQWPISQQEYVALGTSKRVEVIAV